jgi:hypothetical protein
MGFKDSKLPAIHVFSNNSTDKDDNMKVHKFEKDLKEMSADDLIDFIDSVNFRTGESQLPYSQSIIREQDPAMIRIYKLT